MTRINRDKTEKAQLIAKLWQKVGYQAGTTNCGNCEYASKTWSDDHGECKLIDELRFPVLRHGICRSHSNFEE